MEHAEKRCDGIVIMAGGKIEIDGTLAGGKQEGGKSNVALSLTRNAHAAPEVLADRSLLQSVHDAGASAEVQLAAGTDGEQLLRALVAADVGLARFEVIEPSLHSIFIAKVGPEGARPEARPEVA